MAHSIGLRFLLVALVVLPSAMTRAETINLDTNPVPLPTTAPSPWTVSAPSLGVANATPFQETEPPAGGAPYICLSDTCGVSDDPWVQGLNGTAATAAFNGFWTASISFTLPTNVTDIGLVVAQILADDRVVLELNGNPIFATGYNPLAANPEFVLTDGASPAPPPIPFASGSGIESEDSFPNLIIDDPSDFILGGTNILTAIINNTSDGVPGPDVGLMDDDLTAFNLVGEVVYTTVPEPGSGLLFCAALGALRLVRRRRKGRRGDQRRAAA